MSKWGAFRLAHAKERKQGEKELTQHFLEFKAKSWNGKSKHIHVRQTTPICHQAGQTGHSQTDQPSVLYTSSLSFALNTILYKNIHVETYRSAFNSLNHIQIRITNQNDR